LPLPYHREKEEDKRKQNQKGEWPEAVVVGAEKKAN